jgi:A/G-specific adenine glycosylase
MNPTDYPSFRRKLNDWYVDHGRDLPWRRNLDPYQIWISEIMLQQTTVVAVIPYFERFLSRFPTVADLAAADESEILRLWEGLGYYSRARNLHRAAKVIVEQHSGVFPTELDVLQSLPGIGRYTAGAIASFAFDQRAPIIEANTLRLYCLWAFAEEVLPRKGSGRLNQGLMELGATVCSPREPDCESCPVHSYCQAFRDGTQAKIPQSKPKTVITETTEVSIAIRLGTKFLLRKRTSNERWAGLWDFVRFEIELQASELDYAKVVSSVLDRTGLSVVMGPQIAEFKHSVTRYRITLKCFTADRVKGRLKSSEEWEWVQPVDFDEYPLSVTARQFAQQLKKLF